MVFTPVAQIGQFGAILLLAISLLAALVGVMGFAWAMVLLWRENNPQDIMMRGQANRIDDPDTDGEGEMSAAKSPKKRLLAWVGR